MGSIPIPATSDNLAVHNRNNLKTMQKVLKFTNFSNEDFVGHWDGTPWKVKAGETIMLQAYLANHFSKHLIDRELNKKDESTSNQVERAKMSKMCLGDVVVEVESNEKAETEVLNQEAEVSKHLSRKELDKIALDEGIANPEDFDNKQEVIDAINDGRGEDPKTEDKSKKDEEKNKDDKEKVDEEDEFEGNDKDKDEEK